MAGSPGGKLHAAFAERARAVGDMGWSYRDTPVQFWDLYGEQGHPIRTTVSEMGPLLLARLLGLNETQGGVLAIAFHLAECHPDAGLAPPPGDPLRPDFLKWMVHLANTPQPEYRAWFYPHEHVADPAAAPAVKAQAEVRLRGMFERIAALLGAGPWLLGERFSAADLYLFMLIRWGRAMPRPPRALAPLGGLAERVMARPAVRATFAAEGLGEPPF